MKLFIFVLFWFIGVFRILMNFVRRLNVLFVSWLRNECC